MQNCDPFPIAQLVIKLLKDQYDMRTAEFECSRRLALCSKEWLHDKISFVCFFIYFFQHWSHGQSEFT